jgi:Rrf2 family protein
MLTNASKYAIRAVLFLAKCSEDGKRFGIKTIAEEVDIPIHFIAKLLQPLVKEGIISSIKGPNGGYFFTTENGKHNVCDVIHTIEGKPIFDQCFMGLPQCGDENPCPVHHIVAPFKEKMLDKFLHTTLAQFAQEIKDNGSYLSLVGI